VSRRDRRRDHRRRVDRVPDDQDPSDIVHRFPSLADKTAALPGDEWDGMCDLDFEMGPSTTDDLIPWVVLFADLLDTEQQPESREAVERRADEWRALFGGVR
jgi:hypothetical protein